MVKMPVPGRVKTRLGRGIGMTVAAWWFRHQIGKLLRDVGMDKRWKTWLAVTPDPAISSPIWPAHLSLWSQGGGNLGDRMGRVFRGLPNGRVVVIGADVPGISARLIAQAFAALGAADAVIGPSGDGGYWLIGLRRGSRPLPQKLFLGVRWSTQHALEDTLATLGKLRVVLITSLDDVDTADDLVRLSGRSTQSMGAGRSVK